MERTVLWIQESEEGGVRVRCKEFRIPDEFQQVNFWFLNSVEKLLVFEISKFLSRAFLGKVHKVFNDLRGGAAPHPGALGLSSTDQIKK